MENKLASSGEVDILEFARHPYLKDDDEVEDGLFSPLMFYYSLGIVQIQVFFLVVESKEKERRKERRIENKKEKRFKQKKIFNILHRIFLGHFVT